MLDYYWKHLLKMFQKYESNQRPDMAIWNFQLSFYNLVSRFQLIKIIKRCYFFKDYFYCIQAILKSER